MTSFHMWRRSLVKNPAPRQITYVCGEEPVLVEEVVSYVREQLGPEPWNYVSLTAGEDSERLIWAEAEQLPLDNSARIVVIRNADALVNWDRFTAWVKARTSNPRTYLVLVSTLPRVPKTEPTQEERRKGARPEVVEHLAMLGTRGHIIECRSFTSATAKYSVPWAQSKVAMREHVAKHLMERSSFDLRIVRDVLAKLAAFPGEANIMVINDLLAEQPRDSFADALLALDRKTALLALRDISEEDYSRIIGLLDSRLELAGLVHDMTVEHASPRDIAKAAGSQAWLVPDILPVSKHYDAKRRHKIRKALAVADSAHRAGASTGVMEALVLLW